MCMYTAARARAHIQRPLCRRRVFERRLAHDGAGGAVRRPGALRGPSGVRRGRVAGSPSGLIPHRHGDRAIGTALLAFDFASIGCPQSNWVLREGCRAFMKPHVHSGPRASLAAKDC